VPDDLRLTFKILKNADCLPPELDLRRDIIRLRDLLSTVHDSERRRALVGEVNMKILRLNLMRPVPLTSESARLYIDKSPRTDSAQ
jgi:hypothetical protein